MKRSEYNCRNEKALNPVAMIVRTFSKALAVALTMLLAMMVMAVPQSSEDNSILPQAQAQTNPPAQTSGVCGSSVAFVVDLSNSLTANDLTQLKNTLSGLVRSLQGAPYDIALYTFGSHSPFRGTTPPGPLVNIPARSLQTEAGFNEIIRAINAMYINTQGQDTGGTSWAAGLQAVANDMAQHNYEIVYFITDGQPTFDIRGNANRAGNSTEQIEIDEALAQKARIEQAGGRIIPVGIGTNMYNNAAISIYRQGWWPTGWFGSLQYGWGTDSSIRHQALLAQMATSGDTPIIVRDYNALAGQLISNFATGCVQVVKEIVDVDGNVIQNGAGWNFGLSFTGLPTGASRPSEVVTGANGVVEFAIQGATSSARVTITERSQPGYTHIPSSGNNARCRSYQVGGTQAPVTTTNVGSLGVAFNLDPSRIITCTFQNRASVPLKLIKNITVNSTILQAELNNRTYSFSYVCRAGGQIITQGNVPNVPVNREVSLGTNVPVGARCTITESQPAVDEGRYGVQAYWSATNGTVNNSGPGLTTEVTVGREGFTSGNGTTVRATNSYQTETATISVGKQVVGGVPATSLPGTFRVQYSCRYVPDIGNPPEQIPGSPDPYFVASGYVDVPSRGNPVVIPVSDANGNPNPAGGPLMFPVGTQCMLSEIPSTGNPINVDQFNLATTWQSDICLSVGASVGGFNECNTNYIYVDSAGQHGVTVVNTYTRQVGSVLVNALVTGSAASRGIETLYRFTLQCTNGFTRDFNVSAGGNYRIDGVPVGVSCTINQQPSETDIDGVDITPAEPVSINLPGRGEVTSVSVTSVLEYQVGTAVLEKQVIIDETIIDPLVRLELQGKSFPVTGVCEQPDGRAESISDSIVDGRTIEVPNLPIGTICRFTEQDLTGLPEGVEMVNPGPVTIQVVQEGENVETLVNTFRALRADLTITKDVNVTYLRTNDLDEFIPESFPITYTCGDVSGTLTLADGESATIQGIFANAPCVITETPADEPQVERTTEFFGPGGTRPGDSYSFLFPAEGGASVVVSNRYRPALNQITLNKEPVLLDAEGEEITENWADGVITPDRTYPITYTCTRQGGGGTVFPTYTENIRAGEGTSIQVPVGVDCVIEEIGQSIPGTTGPVDTYSLNNGAPVEDRVLVPVNGTQPAQTVDIRNEYQMQYGSFSLKKKVDGEGVATISADRDFRFGYVCTMGSGPGRQVVAQNAPGEEFRIGRFDTAADFTVTGIPLGADCVVTEDLESAAEPAADLDNRWTVADSSTGWGAREDACGTGVAVTCSTDTENAPNQATFRITDTQERPSADVSETGLLPENFQGTFILWNTYTYWKTMLEVDKELAGDGPALAAEDTFNFQLVCTHPTYASGEFEDLPFIQDPTITQSVSITGAGNATAPTPVPVGYECSITESQVGGYDAVVTTTFTGEDLQGSSDPQDPTGSEGATAGFVVAATGATTDGVYVGGDPQRIIVTNDYERPRAELTVAKQLIGGENDDNVNEYINSPGVFTMNWVCTDQYIENTTYSGTVDVVPGAGPSSITLENGIRIPQGVLCSVAEDTGGKIPIGFEDVVNSSHAVQVTRGDQTVFQQANAATTGEFSLTGESVTTVEFTNSYWVEQDNLGFTKYIEGDPDGIIFPPTGENSEGNVGFGFDFRCEVNNLLPGQPVPEIPGAGPVTEETGPEGGLVVSGTFSLRHGEQWGSGALPEGSTCQISEQGLSPETQQALEDNGLRMQPNYVYPTENPELPEPDQEEMENPDVVQQPVVGDAPRTQLDEGESVPLGGEYGSHAWLLNSLYRADGEIQVQKVSYPDDQPLAGARFAIYGMDPTAVNSLGDVVAEDLRYVSDEDQTRFTVNLRPGSYFLVETRSGTRSELLPAPWRFDVSPTNGGELGDLEFVLSAYDRNSGLIEVERPEDDPRAPWIIKVANVESGELPLTGGSGIWQILGVGGGLLLLALVSWMGVHRRRN